MSEQITALMAITCGAFDPVPIGQITVLMRDEDIQLCESCGRYLYLPDPADDKPVEQPAAAKPVAKAQAYPSGPAPAAVLVKYKVWPGCAGPECAKRAVNCGTNKGPARHG